MTDEKNDQCKSKGCTNPVIKGKYCESCKQKRKEKRVKIAKGVSIGVTTVVAVGGLALKVVSDFLNHDKNDL